MYTLDKRCEFIEEIKKSRFIATAFPIESPTHAIELVKTNKDPSANHNCYAYRVEQNYRFFDDGEPGGTAGRPILSAIEGRDLDGVLVIVTRFFGGIKLGAGGLVRAYGGTAAKCLSQASILEIRPKTVVKVTAGFDAVGVIYGLMDDFGCEKKSETFGESGIELGVELEQASLDKFIVALADATRGKAVIDCD